MSTPGPLPSTTQADQVFDRLRAEILSCRLAPGMKIRINEFALRFAVSLGSVREALSRLSAEGLVIAQAQKGNTVAPVSVAELADLTKTRIAIEQLCLRSAVQHGDGGWERHITSANERLRRLPERDPSDPSILDEHWLAEHAQFHFALVAACDSPALLRIRSGLFAQSERYRRLSVPLQREVRNVEAEHNALMEAALERDADYVCGLMSNHLWRTTRVLLTSPVLAAIADD